jgi:class 3 adenylate cyclase
MAAMSEAPATPPAAASDPLGTARAAIASHDWTIAFELLSGLAERGDLAGEDYEALAQAAFFAARPDAVADARERAFKAYLAAGDELRAAFVALNLARDAGQVGNVSIAAGWMRRGERLLPEGGETYVHGWFALARSEAAAAMNRPDEAMPLAERAVEIATRTGDADLRAWSLAHLGELKIRSGATPDGMALLEEASIAAVNGELSPFTSGVTACRMISACRDLYDLRRASEWIDATERYCQRESLGGFPGVCRVHRAEVAAIGGAWDRAETDLLRATAELERYRATPPQADGYYALGEVRRLRGDFEGAEEALREAHARGRSPQPALALIRLAQGKVKAAVTAIEDAVADESWNKWAVARLQPARVEILIAAGELARARAAIDELTAAIVAYPSPAFEAGRRAALGRVLLAEGDAAAAARELRAGIRTWQEVGAPYEVARARSLLGTALEALDDEESAFLELRAAVEEFRRLGAAMDLADGERRLAASEDRRNAPEQVRRAFLFTDIVGSTVLAETLGDAAWEGLLRWHDDALRRTIAGGGGEVVNSTGDGFFAAFETARRALDCAIAIQRSLRDHRESVGFAPPVRIGVHSADANRRGRDYGGIGVHVAARVAALAAGGEILATEATLAEAGITGAEAQEVSVKGVSTPIHVASVAWS